MTIYNTYRPRTFEDVIGQEHVVRTLRNAIARDIIGHAYLFTGVRGTGKTTIGRIFAHAINCMPRDGFTPCDEKTCEAIAAGKSLDIVEVDAASHTGVDHVRALREAAATPPLHARYKVYIIDEAHMLSTAAWNALLKILEEPPPQTIFLFATTDAHKIPATILSRVQRFDLRRLSVDAIAGKLATIARAENITLADDVAIQIAVAADGSMRDAESLLAQLIAFTDDGAAITGADVALITGSAEQTVVYTIMEHIIAGARRDALAAVAQATEHGTDAARLTLSCATLARHILLAHIDDELLAPYAHLYASPQRARIHAMATQASGARLRTIALTLQEAAMTQSPLDTLPLEIAIIDLTAPDAADDDAAPPHDAEKTDASQRADTARSKGEEVSTTTETQRDDDASVLARLTASWPRVIAHVKKRSAPRAALLRHSAPHAYTDGTVTVVTSNALLAEKMRSDSTMRLTLTDAIATILERPVQCVVHHADDAPANTHAPLAAAIATIRGTFIADSGA